MEIFCPSLESKYLTLSSDGYCVAMPPEHDMLTNVFTREQMCQFHTALCPTEKNVSWCLYVLFVNGAEWLKTIFNYEWKSQIHNETHNHNKNL